MKSERNPVAADRYRIEGPSQQGMLEFKTFRFPLGDFDMRDLPTSPGAVERDACGRAILLHVAPGRFLVPAPIPERIRHLEALQAAGAGVLFNAEGKWQTFALTGPRADRVLACSIDLTQVLRQRECVALRLFDCPAMLARSADAFDVWVDSSYASAFCERVNHSAMSMANESA